MTRDRTLEERKRKRSRKVRPILNKRKQKRDSGPTVVREK